MLIVNFQQGSFFHEWKMAYSKKMLETNSFFGSVNLTLRTHDMVAFNASKILSGWLSFWQCNPTLFIGRHKNIRFFSRFSLTGKRPRHFHFYLYWVQINPSYMNLLGFFSTTGSKPNIEFRVKRSNRIHT